MSMLTNSLSSSISPKSGWSLPGLIRAMLSTRRDMRKISALAQRQRIPLGYRRVPQRVWDRRSALFIDN